LFIYVEVTRPPFVKLLTMGPFFAYVVQDSNASPLRYAISFASRDAADEWWRDLSGKTTTIKRVTPQYYTWTEADEKFMSYFRTNSEFSGKGFFTSLPRDGLLVIPEANIRDHVNTETFFIRSKRDPSIYWHVDGSGNVEASRTKCTKFLISIKGDYDAKKIMIGTDDILITVAFKAAGSACTCTTCSSCTCSPCMCMGASSFLAANNNGKLVLGSSPTTFKFSDFKNGFEIESIANRDDSPSATAIVKVDDGEAWELV